MTLNTIPSVAGVDDNGEPTDNPKLAMLEVLDKFHSAISNWMVNMAFPVVEFSREGYKIRKVFG
jgi:LDH2 family malate/lactate/ureidoglycolate dehydrogenase